MATADALRTIQAELSQQFLERSEAIEGLILATLAGEHAFLLGPPGTAKSLLVRELVSRFEGARYFETVLSKNRPDAAVLGPYDMGALRERSEFIRKDEGFLTAVDVAFVDEIGKMSPTLGHDMLAALNERLKHEVIGGRSTHPIPLHSAFTASNELVAADSEDAQALWDRLLVRIEVDYISAQRNFRALLTGVRPARRTTVSWEAVRFAAAEAAEVALTDGVLDLVAQIREALRREGHTVSDRRWRDSMKVVRAAAYLRGENEAVPEDLNALRFTLWDTPDQAPRIRRAILAVASPESEEVAKLADELAALAAELQSRKGTASDKFLEFVLELKAKCEVVTAQAKKLAKTLESPRAKAEVDGILAHAVALVEEAIEASPMKFTLQRETFEL